MMEKNGLYVYSIEKYNGYCRQVKVFCKSCATIIASQQSDLLIPICYKQ